jgi:hypothetical protein
LTRKASTTVSHASQRLSSAELALDISAPVERYQVMKDELVSAVASLAAKARSVAPMPADKAD